MRTSEPQILANIGRRIKGRAPERIRRFFLLPFLELQEGLLEGRQVRVQSQAEGSAPA